MDALVDMGVKQGPYALAFLAIVLLVRLADRLIERAWDRADEKRNPGGSLDVQAAARALGLAIAEAQAPVLSAVREQGQQLALVLHRLTRTEEDVAALRDDALRAREQLAVERGRREASSEFTREPTHRGA